MRRRRRRRRCSSSSSQPRHFEEAVAHTNGARYVGGAVCSERGRGLHQSNATVLEAAADTEAAAAGACTTAKAAVQAKDSSSKARACRARTQSCRQRKTHQSLHYGDETNPKSDLISKAKALRPCLWLNCKVADYYLGRCHWPFLGFNLISSNSAVIQMAFHDAVNRTCAKVILRTAHIPQIECEQSHKIGPLFTVSPGSCMFTQMSREKRPQTDSPLPYIRANLSFRF